MCGCDTCSLFGSGRRSFTPRDLLFILFVFNMCTVITKANGTAPTIQNSTTTQAETTWTSAETTHPTPPQSTATTTTTKLDETPTSSRTSTLTSSTSLTVTTSISAPATTVTDATNKSLTATAAPEDTSSKATSWTESSTEQTNSTTPVPSQTAATTSAAETTANATATTTATTTEIPTATTITSTATKPSTGTESSTKAETITATNTASKTNPTTETSTTAKTTKSTAATTSPPPTTVTTTATTAAATTEEDACKNDTINCGNGTCSNDPGGEFHCDCNKGYTGQNCDSDIKECDDDTLNECSLDANCIEEVGSYNCSCLPEYEGDGFTCTDIDECFRDHQCNNSSTCLNTKGSYICMCQSGWSGEFCEHDIDECNTTQCAMNAECNNFDGSYNCTCNDGYHGVGESKCYKNVMIGYDMEVKGEQGDDEIYGPYFCSEGIPYFSKTYHSIYVSMNGYLSLGQRFSSVNPQNAESWPQDIPIVAPLWADIDTQGINNSGLDIREYISTNMSANATLRTIAVAIAENITLDYPFHPHYALIATWRNAAPTPANKTIRHENVTFQVILATDRLSTFILFNYDLALFNWHKAGGRYVAIGYTNNNGTGYLLEHKNNSIDSTELPTPVLESEGRIVVNVTGTVTSENVQDAQCRKELKNLMSMDDDPIVVSSVPCPCTAKQAESDKNFTKVGDCYQPMYTNMTIPRCCYSNSGSLLTGYPRGGYTLVNGSENVHNVCCASSSNGCTKFYDWNPSDNCSRYSPSNQLPSFENNPNVIHVHQLKRFNLPFDISGSDNIQVDVSTNISEDSYKLDNTTLTHFVFTWNVSDAYRDRNIYLKFTATDEQNASSEYWPEIHYCGCDKTEQCLSDINIVADIENRFYSKACKCNTTATGKFCQITDVCSSVQCYPGLTCNATFAPNRYCNGGKCRDGLQGDGLKCYDVNECYRTPPPCEQVCINTVGSYTCNCRKGYSKDENSCVDVNECLEPNRCNETEYCKNTIGSYTCQCLPGYFNKSSGCEKVQYSYVGIIVFTVNTHEDLFKGNILTGITNGLKDKLRKVFNISGSEPDVELLPPTPTNNTRLRTRRAVQRVHRLSSEFILYYSKQESTAAVQQVFKKYKERSCTRDNCTALKAGDGSWVIINSEGSGVYPDGEAPLCKIVGKTDCQADSTECVTVNGTYSCRCKDGFRIVEHDNSYCEDVDECHNHSCTGGTCKNTIGSWYCDCPNGYYSDGGTCHDICDKGPCKNDGTCSHAQDSDVAYICKCPKNWKGFDCSEANSEADSEAEKLKNVIIGVGAGVGGICLLLLLALLGMCRRNYERKHPIRHRPLSTLDDFSWGGSLMRDIPPDESVNGSSGAMRIPRPQVSSTGNNYEMMERGKDVHVTEKESGKFDDAKIPLTSFDKETLEGKENTSFLHTESGKRTSELNRPQNRYEYF